MSDDFSEKPAAEGAERAKLLRQLDEVLVTMAQQARKNGLSESFINEILDLKQEISTQPIATAATARDEAEAVDKGATQAVDKGDAPRASSTAVAAPRSGLPLPKGAVPRVGTPGVVHRERLVVGTSPVVEAIVSRKPEPLNAVKTAFKNNTIVHDRLTFGDLQAKMRNPRWEGKVDASKREQFVDVVRQLSEMQRLEKERAAERENKGLFLGLAIVVGANMLTSSDGSRSEQDRKRERQRREAQAVERTSEKTLPVEVLPVQLLTPQQLLDLEKKRERQGPKLELALVPDGVQA